MLQAGRMNPLWASVSPSVMPTGTRRSEFKRCWKGQGACRTYCTRHETYMHMCPDASLCCVAYGIRPLPSKTEPV
uniref:Beta-defensin n=1 Tax=Felis catus TaxID=9685 RepID=A0ABI8A2J9_FELCA